MEKFVVDSSSLISLSGSCLIRLMQNLAETAGVSLFIPESVYRESVERPLKIKRFELNAIRIQDAIDSGYLKIGRELPGLAETTEKIEECGDCMVFSSGKRMKLIQKGEAETLALAKTLGAKVVVIDERTTRLLAENPYSLRKFLQGRHSVKISIDRQLLEGLHAVTKGLSFIRSSELVALAYRRKLFEPELQQTKQALEAALYAVKFGGCAVSNAEIERYLKGVRA